MAHRNPNTKQTKKKKNERTGVARQNTAKQTTKKATGNYSSYSRNTGKKSGETSTRISRNTNRRNHQQVSTGGNRMTSEGQDRFKNLTQGALRQSAGSIRKGLSTVMSVATENRAKGGGASGTVAHRGNLGGHTKRTDRMNGTEKMALESDVQKTKERTKALSEAQDKYTKIESRNASKQIEKGNKQIEKGKEGLGAVGRFAADAYTGALQMGTDIAAGALMPGGALTPMFARAAGGAMDEAEKAGASRGKAIGYGLATGGVEVATEKIFNVGSALKGAYGKGVADAFIDKIANKAAKSTGEHLGKTISAAVVTEALEEMIAEGIEPGIANMIYANAIGGDAVKPTLFNNPDEASKNIAYAGALGGVLGGVMGGAGSVISTYQGKKLSDNYENVFGEGGVKEVAQQVLASAEDSKSKAKAQSILDNINNGKGVAYGEVAELEHARQKQVSKDRERMQAQTTVSEKVVKENGYSSPVDRNGYLGKAGIKKADDAAGRTRRWYADRNVKQTWEENPQEKINDNTINTVARAEGMIASGIATPEDVNVALGTTDALTVTEQITGLSLAEMTPAEQKDALYSYIADAYVQTAKEQTKAVQNMLSTEYRKEQKDMGTHGQMAAKSILGDIDTRAIDDEESANMTQEEIIKAQNQMTTFGVYYNAGLIGEDISEVNGTNPIFEELDDTQRTQAYNAGKLDRMQKLGELQLGFVKGGTTINRAKNLKAGTVNMEDVTDEEFINNYETDLTVIAQEMGIEIVVHDTLGDVNGSYSGGVMHLAIDNQQGALEYLFSHELTHHLQNFAPVEYEKLKMFVKGKMKQSGVYESEMNNVRKQYAQDSLSDDVLFDEVLANNAMELFKDKSFVEDLASYDIPTTRKVLDAIRSIMTSIRNMIARHSESEVKEGLYSQLDILKDVEKLYLDALAKAVENKHINATDNNLGVKDFSISHNEMNRNVHTVHKMKPIGTVEFSADLPISTKIAENVSTAEDYLKAISPMSFNRTDVGNVTITKDGLSDILTHNNYKYKMSVLGVIPNVLNNGKIVAADIKHKRRKFNTVTIVAPVEMVGSGLYKNDTAGIYYAAVTLKRTHHKDNTIGQNLHVIDVLIEKDSRNIDRTFLAENLPNAENLYLRDILRRVAADVNIFEESDEQINYSRKYTPEEEQNHIETVAAEMKEYYGSAYTDNYNQAGYILPDGKLLNMGADGERYEDHRVVATAYDDLQGTDAMIQFMNEGNIRFMPEAYAVEIIAEPTKEQYAAIEELSKNAENGITVEIDDELGRGSNVVFHRPELVVPYIKGKFSGNNSEYHDTMMQFYQFSRKDVEKRNSGQMLTEKEFYRLYSVHKVRSANDVAGIMENGFQGGAGFGINVMPASTYNLRSRTIQDYIDEMKQYGVELTEEDVRKSWAENKNLANVGDTYYEMNNLAQREYHIRKGDTYMLVPDNELESGQGEKSKITQGFKPKEYEILHATEDFQNIYELYKDAYTKDFIAQHINEDKILDHFGIEKISDYIHVQKKVIETLPDEYYKAVIVESSGMVVNISRRGVKETFNLENYKAFSREGKLLKLATIENVPELIKKATVVNEGTNKHTANKKSAFTYLISETHVNGIPVTVNIVIKKGHDTNKFHLHNVEINSEQLHNLFLKSGSISEFAAHNDSVTHGRLSRKVEPEINEDDVIDEMSSDPTIVEAMYGWGKYTPEGQNLQEQTKEELIRKIKKLQQDMTITGGKVLDTKSVTKEMNNLVVTMMSIEDEWSAANRGEVNLNKTNLTLVNSLVGTAKIIWKELQNGNYEAAAISAMNVSEYVVDNLLLTEDSQYRQYKELVNYLKDIKWTVNPIYYEDFDGGWTQFKKNNQGKIRMANTGTSPDEKWSEMCQLWPEFFNEEIDNPADQMKRMAEVRNSLEPYDYMLSEDNQELLLRDAAGDILEIVANGKPLQTWADKREAYYNEKISRLKARQEEAIRDIKRVQNFREAERKLASQMAEGRKVAKEKRKAEERKQFGKEQRQKNAIIKKITGQLDWLSERLLSPSDAKHLPEGYRKVIAEMLAAIDPQTERSRKLEEEHGVSKKRFKWLNLQREYREIAEGESYGFILDEEVIMNLDELSKTLEDGDQKLANMTLQELDMIYNTIRSIKHGISQQNKMFSDELKGRAADFGRNAINTAEEAIEKYGQKKGVPLLDTSNAAARDFFEDIGGGINEAFLGLRKGFDKHIRNIDFMRGFFDSIFSEYGKTSKFRKHAIPGSELETWRDGKNKQTFELPGGTIELTPAQVMSLYCLMKREQGQSHIFGSGIKAAVVNKRNIVLGESLKEFFTGKGDKETRGRKVTVTPEDVHTILSTMTEEQKEIADKLQNLMSTTMSKWGNDASMKLFGYKKFTEDFYFPIECERTYLSSDFDVKQTAERVKNPNFAKATKKGASNPVVIDDIFSVVSSHCSRMSMYNALAPAIADFQRIYNYIERDEEGRQIASVKESLQAAYGDKTLKYIERFMTDLNGTTPVTMDDITRFVTKSLANYNKAAIGGNLRVALQQPTAVMRAMLYINPKYFAGRMHLAREMNDMKKHCPIALWKSWGFSQVDLARDLEDIMMNQEWSRLDMLTMEIYGFLDNVTWGQIWRAVKKEVAANNKDVKVGSDEFYELCNERASYIFDKTQVVDSVFHRSQAMRNKDPMSKLLTSFMSEPTRTFNMIWFETKKARRLWQIGEKKEATKVANKAYSIFVVNAAVVSMAAAVADAIRGKGGDDDDDDTWFKLWWQNTVENFKGNANVFKLIPFVNQVIETKDWGTSNAALESFEAMFKAIDNFRNDEMSFAKKVRGIVEAGGYMFGVPTKNVLREVENVCKALGIDIEAAFAAEDGTEETAEENKATFQDKFLESFGFKEPKNKEEVYYDTSTGKRIGGEKHNDSELEDYLDSNVGNTGLVNDIFNKMDFEEGGKIDEFLDKRGYTLTEDEASRKAFDSKVQEAIAAGEGKSGDEKWKAIYKKCVNNYTNYILDGDMDTIKEMRKVLKQAGGGDYTAKYFDEKVLGYVTKDFKKTIGDEKATGRQAKYREYMLGHGMTEEEISGEIIYKSDTAKEFAIACQVYDKEEAVARLRDLYSAGFLDADVDRLYENRNRYDAKGKYNVGVSTGKFTWPCSGTISSHFGYRKSPGGIGSTNHPSIDIAVSSGTQVCAADGGTVVYTGWYGGYGNQVGIDHGNGYVTYYSHLSGWDVSVGDKVAKGQPIARSGSTGNSTGPHLDFKILKDGSPVNPESYLN